MSRSPQVGSTKMIKSYTCSSTCRKLQNRYGKRFHVVQPKMASFCGEYYCFIIKKNCKYFIESHIYIIFILLKETLFSSTSIPLIMDINVYINIANVPSIYFLVISNIYGILLHNIHQGLDVRQLASNSLISPSSYNLF